MKHGFDGVASTDRMTPVFISVQTTAFSGATLLSFLLSTHPQIATVGEMNGLIARENPEVYLCSCGQKIKDCAFWKSIEIAMRDRGFEFYVDHFGMEFALGGPPVMQYLRTRPFRNGTLEALRDAIFQAMPRERRQLRALVARNEALVDSVLTVAGGRVFVDTSKDRLRLTALRRFSRFDIRAIHLVRDVRGVVASRLQRRRGVDAPEAARQWAKAHQDLQITLGSWPEGKHIQVRYEDLCRDVQGTMERIYRFCEVDPVCGDTDFRASPRHIIGNPMRLSNLSEIQPDERWRSQLTQEQLEEIQRVAGSLSQQYGYC
jgi:sulfotransferase family protein